MLLLVALSVAACLVPTVRAQQLWPHCGTPKMSSFRVNMRNFKNSSGHWTTQVVFKQGQPTVGDEWFADIDQKVLSCDGQEATLETVVNIEAPPKGSSPLVSLGPLWLPQHVLPTVTPDCTRVPPPGYELFPGVGYYKFHEEKLAWPYARRVCSAEGGHLIILNSQVENDVAVQIYARHPRAGVWFHTGILEMGIHAEWFTLFGVPLEKTGYTLIRPGENNARGPSDFGAMHRSGFYADVTVNVKYPFICEFDL